MSRHPEAKLLDRYEDLSAADRDEILVHAETCASCRRELGEVDPTRLFALLSRVPVSEAALDRLGGSLDRALDRGDARSPGSRWLGAAASIAASLALAAALGSFVLRTATELPLAVAPASVADGVVLAREGDPTPGGIQLISSPGEAQVMELSIGETQVVMIFDEALDI